MNLEQQEIGKRIADALLACSYNLIEMTKKPPSDIGESQSHIALIQLSIALSKSGIEILDKYVTNVEEKVDILKKYHYESDTQIIPTNPNFHFHNGQPCYNNPCVWC